MVWFCRRSNHRNATRKSARRPGIVTVITAEEIKNLGYRTFVEILRTIPGFEILKDGSNGVVVPAVSQAPGRVHDGRQEYDINLEMVYKDFYLEGWYINKNQGTFIGPQFALTDESYIESNYVFGEAGYKKTFEERLTLNPGSITINLIRTPTLKHF